MAPRVDTDGMPIPLSSVPSDRFGPASPRGERWGSSSGKICTSTSEEKSGGCISSAVLNCASRASRLNATGYSNLITYDVLFHVTNREARIRPFIAGGAGAKIYTGNQLRSVGLPLIGSAVLVPCTQVEPAISVGGGLKFRVSRHGLLRLDFRTYMTPLPDRILRPTGLSQVHGWVYNFVPLGGLSFVF